MIPQTATDKQQGSPEPESEKIKLCTVWGHWRNNTIYIKTQARISKSKIWKIEKGNPTEACVHPWGDLRSPFRRLGFLSRHGSNCSCMVDMYEGRGRERRLWEKTGGKPAPFPSLPSGLPISNQGSRDSHGKEQLLSARLATTSGNECTLGARQFILDNLE